ncbi:MAG TPA: alpha/beta hydrolase [Actinomycetes bacterium]|nr:alpha/beta hydrolase [Actinomycetes bacterium]
METARSKDGTSIAYDRSGEGPPVVIVGGALQHRAAEAPLAALLAAEFTVFAYDHRGRGDSGDTPPYAVDREVEDLDAIIAAAGGSACVYGSSSGANLAIVAAAQGLGIAKLAVHEPNYLVDASRPPLPGNYVEHLNQLLPEGRRGDAVAYFLTTAVGLPAEFVAPMRDLPVWQAMEAAAPTLPYDGAVVEGFALPTNRLAAVSVPTLVIAGEASAAWLRAGAQAAADALPNARCRTLEGQDHNVAAEAVAAVLREFFAG